jgi:predicted lipid-binding transport protein (Tim44 family)
MRRPSLLFAVVAATLLALAPGLADARPGGGASMGSRGARTFSAPPSTNTAPSPARPMERSMTEPSRAPGQMAPAAAPMGAPAGGMGRTFMTGLMGGLIGAGIAGMLFGGGAFGGMGGFSGFLGFLLQVGLVALLVWLVVGFFRRRSAQPALAGMPQGMSRQMMGGPNPPLGANATGSAAAASAFAPGPADLQAFEQTLKAVNAAWSRQDLTAMQRLCTPEMVQYFADDLAGLASRGLHNETSDVRLEQGDISEAWREGTREFATVAMRFSLLDVTRRVSDGALVEGDLAVRTQAVELWTFVRVQGGQWLLSGIQQTAR